ncbi:putative TELO2-interacting protein 1-like protein [Hypsibius exemplaris]|uniref:TELO2-interacting protein 1-like protein n=1 Tax=Hypsibius exemplaris TaxID=2072580 RepID=A0A1W0WHV9_HYPEX|nr:putative TELO2-interacting protein 1-like protein [Hypsibius exemplaris]
MEEQMTVLQSLSLKILLKPAPEILEVFLSEIQHLPAATVTEFQDCLLFPALSCNSETKSNQRSLELSLRIVHQVLSKSSLTTWTVFRDIVGSLCLTTNDILTDAGKGPGFDEVLAVLLMETSYAAFSCLDDSTLLTAINDPKELKMIHVLWSNAVFQCVDLLGKTPSRDVRLSCLRLLKATTMDAVDRVDCRRVFGGLFASFLPGITGACLSLAKDTATPFVGQVVLAETLATFSTVLCLVYGDEQAIGQDTAERTVTDGFPPDPRTVAWVAETVPKISLSLQNMAHLAAVDSAEVRLSLVLFSKKLLSSCLKSLRTTFPVLVRLLLPLAEDAFANVSAAALDVLQFFRSSVAADECDLVWGLLQEDFITLLDSLPYLSSNQSEQTFISALKTCCGYCTLLGSQLAVLLSSGDMMERFTDILLHLSELDYRNVDLMTYSTTDVADSPYTCTRLSGRETARQFDRLLFCLGKQGLSAGILQHLSGVLSDRFDVPSMNGVIFLTNNLIRNAEKPMQELHAVSVLLQLYISSDWWTFSTSTQAAILSRRCVLDGEASSQGADELSLLRYKQQVVGLCLLLDGLAVTAEALGQTSQRTLHSTLCRLLEKTVSEVPLVEAHALQALKSLSRTYGYSSVSELIVDNMEYVTSTVLIRIRSLHRHPKTVFILQAALKLSSPDILPSIWKIVTFLLDKLDEFHSVAALPFVVVLAAVIRKIAEWNAATEPALTVAVPDRVDEAVRYLQEGCDLQNTSTELDEGISGQGEEPIPDLAEEEEVEPEVPTHVTFTVNILQRCAYLLPVDDRNLRTTILDIVREGCSILGAHKTQLLPVIHKVWTSVILLHRSPDLVILKKTTLMARTQTALMAQTQTTLWARTQTTLWARTQTILMAQTQTILMARTQTTLMARTQTTQNCGHVLEMSEVAGSFLRQRVSTDIIPVVTRVLGKERHIADHWSPTEQLLITLLTSLPRLLKRIDAEDSVCEIVAAAVLPFLSPDQPAQLRQQAVGFFRELAVQQPDLVVVKMTEACDVLETFHKPGLPSVRRRRAVVTVPEADVCHILQDVPSYKVLFPRPN